MKMLWHRLYFGRVRNGRKSRSGIWVTILLVVVFGVGPAGAATWSFVVTGDSLGFDNGLNEEILSEIAREIAHRDVDFLLFTGDLVDCNSAVFENCLINWREIMQPIYDANIAVYPCRGNHDHASGFVPDWQRVFADLPDNGPVGEEHMTYSVRHKNAFIASLDLYANGNPVNVNQVWLDGELAANDRPHVFFFGHEPAFAANHQDSLDDDPEKRDTFWASIRDAGGRTYFCSHDHFYDHARVIDGDGDPNNDIHQYIAGTAGSGFYDFTPPYEGDNGDYTVEQWYHAANYGYILVEIDGFEARLTWMERMMGTEGEWEYRANDVWSYRVRQAITVVWPDGGESVVGGNEYSIEWRTDAEADVEHLVIEYSTNGGANWSAVATVGNSGSYEWIVPGVDSQKCVVRVSDLEDRTVADISDDMFTIFQCRGPIGGDVNGDCYTDFFDLASIASDWAEGAALGQIAVLAEAWCECGNPFDVLCEE